MINILINLVIAILFVVGGIQFRRTIEKVRADSRKNYELALDLHERDIRSSSSGDPDPFTGSLSEALTESDTSRPKE